MYSAGDDPEGSGFPIRIFPDQSLLTTPRNFSQPATSFIASRRQGIHQMPFSRLIRSLNRTCIPSHARRTATPEGAKSVHRTKSSTSCSREDILYSRSRTRPQDPQGERPSPGDTFVFDSLLHNDKDHTRHRRLRRRHEFTWISTRPRPADETAEWWS